jgi:hypothetical protein
MFNAKRIDTGEIFQVLDTHFDSKYTLTYFLVWDNGGWRWRPARNFVPPNVEVKNDKNKN